MRGRALAGRGVPPQQARGAVRRAAKGGLRCASRLLDLANPLRDPVLPVVAVLVFLEEVGQSDPWWVILAICLANLLAVRLLVLPVTLAVLFLLTQVLRAKRRATPKAPAARVLQGASAMDAYIFTSRGVTFQITYGYPYCGRAFYQVLAQRGADQAPGWVRYAQLALGGARLDCLEFSDAPTWLGAALAPHLGEFEQRERTPARVSVVPADPQAAALTAWLEEDYRSRLYEIIALIEAGCTLPQEYSNLWYFTLCAEADVNPAEEPTPPELAEAFRLFEAHASYDVRDQARRVRLAAKRARLAEAMGRWNTWVSRHLGGLVATSVFPSARLRAWGAPITFANSRHEAQTTYEPIGLDGGHRQLGYLESYGDNVQAYVPPAVAGRWYAERWYAERTALGALGALDRMLRSGGRGPGGDDYARWIYGHEGQQGLLALARAGAPLAVAPHLVHCFAVASKFYRIPIAVTLSEEHYLGYGVPCFTRDWFADRSTPGSLPERELRLYGWVTHGAEERDAWPGEPDIAALQSETRRLAFGYQVNFE